MKIALVGNKGSMGTRYTSILRYLREDVLLADIGDPWWDWEFDRAIICTPTDRHSNDLRMALSMGKPILCEKPICKDSHLVSSLKFNAEQCNVDVRMVSNWLYAVNSVLGRANGYRGKVANMGEMHIKYSNFRTGNDGLFWDCIQPIYLAGKFTWDTTSPIFEASVDGENIPYKDLEESYISMMSDWLYSESNRLWTLGDAMKATMKVERAMAGYTGGFPPSGEVTFET